MNRKKIVAGNWKMNLSLEDAKSLAKLIVQNSSKQNDVIKIIIPPFTYIESVAKILSPENTVFLGAQNCSSHNKGAFTGEISASMLNSVGCNYVLIGHSERRIYFKETNADLVLKIKQALENNLIPILCVGETIDERKSGNHFNVITKQIQEVLKHFSINEFRVFIIAYEPVWAIGTGETATPKQAQEMHAFIRNIIIDLYDSHVAGEVPILYGGSCNSQNAKELFMCQDIDGGLIGGASLKSDDFCQIISSF